MKTIINFINEKLTLYHYVNEKLILNKQSEIYDEEYYLIIPYDHMFFKIDLKYNNFLYKIETGFCVFICDKETTKEIANKYSNELEDCLHIYEFPSYYKFTKSQKISEKILTQLKDEIISPGNFHAWDRTKEEEDKYKKFMSNFHRITDPNEII